MDKIRSEDKIFDAEIFDVYLPHKKT